MLICIYYVLDFISTSTLCILFVWKLLSVRTKRHDITVSHRNKQIAENKQLTKLAKKTLILTIISIISSWILMYPSSLSINDTPFHILRWFYPLDYGINGLCIFLMFQWRIFKDFKWKNLCQNSKTDQYEESNQFENDEENDKIDSVEVPEFSVKDKENRHRHKQIDIDIKNEQNSKQRLTPSMLMHKSRPSVDIEPDMEILTGFNQL